MFHGDALRCRGRYMLWSRCEASARCKSAYYCGLVCLWSRSLRAHIRTNPAYDERPAFAHICFVPHPGILQGPQQPAQYLLGAADAPGPGSRRRLFCAIPRDSHQPSRSAGQLPGTVPHDLPCSCSSLPRFTPFYPRTYMGCRYISVTKTWHADGETGSKVCYTSNTDEQNKCRWECFKYGFQCSPIPYSCFFTPKSVVRPPTPFARCLHPSYCRPCPWSSAARSFLERTCRRPLSRPSCQRANLLRELPLRRRSSRRHHRLGHSHLPPTTR